ncbi:hypothetical protein BGW38_004292, partial [Lunasporangiospora selenospora]
GELVQGPEEEKIVGDKIKRDGVSEQGIIQKRSVIGEQKKKESGILHTAFAVRLSERN